MTIRHKHHQARRQSLPKDKVIETFLWACEMLADHHGQSGKTITHIANVNSEAPDIYVISDPEWKKKFSEFCQDELGDPATTAKI